MLLKDFDWDFPLEEMASRSRLGFETRYIMALYRRCFPKLKVDGGWKVLVECVPCVTRPKAILGGGGVFMIETQFDLATYQASDTAHRKRIALETLQKSVLAVAAAFGWPAEPFEAAYKGVIERNYVNEWTWPKSPKSSPDRKHKAYVQCLHEHDGFYAWIVVEDKKGNKIGKEFAFKALPDELCFMNKLEKLEWSSNERVVLFDYKGNEVKALSIPI